MFLKHIGSLPVAMDPEGANNNRASCAPARSFFIGVGLSNPIIIRDPDSDSMLLVFECLSV
jgi:hypothetical protein